MAVTVNIKHYYKLDVFRELQLRKSSRSDLLQGRNTQNLTIGNFQEPPGRSVIFLVDRACTSLKWAHWAGFFASGQLGAWQHRLWFDGACHLA